MLNQANTARQDFTESWFKMVAFAVLAKYRVNKITRPPKPTILSIMEDVCAKHGVNVADVKAPSKKIELVMARREIVYRARHETGHSYKAIGRMMGGRCRTTISSLYYGWQRLLDVKAGDRSQSRYNDSLIDWSLVE
jgi:chromosomal replication initiation ATPase DnaA